MKNVVGPRIREARYRAGERVTQEQLEWLTQRYPTIATARVTEIISPLREVRKLRQGPAHAVREDRYDKRFYEMQDALVWRVYRALNALRQILMTDDTASGYEPPSWEGRTVKSY